MNRYVLVSSNPYRRAVETGDAIIQEDIPKYYLFKARENMIQALHDEMIIPFI